MQNKMVLLVDNSLEYLSVAIAFGDEIVEERYIKGRESASQILAKEVEEIIKKRGLSLKDLSALMCTSGPGSFTGIRVALSFLKGLKIGLRIPLVGVPTLDCMAHEFSFLKGFRIIPLIDAKKGEVFYSVYLSTGGELKRLTEYVSEKPASVIPHIERPCFIFGSGLILLRELLTDKEPDIFLCDTFTGHVSLRSLLELGLRQLGFAHENVVPVYGRRSEAEIKFNVQLT